MGTYLSLIGRGSGWGGRLFEAWCLLTFSAFRMGTYSRWALIQGWVLIRTNTVFQYTRISIISISTLTGVKKINMCYNVTGRMQHLFGLARMIFVTSNWTALFQ